MVTREELLKIADLSKLSVDLSELEALTQDMARIIGFADRIRDVSAGETVYQERSVNAFREDIVYPSFPREEILKNVGGGEDGYIPVKVIQQEKRGDRHD